MGILRRQWLVIVIVVLAIILAVLVYASWPTNTRVVASTLKQDAALIERGRYVAAAGDCAACHTAPDGWPFSGGLAIASPLGAIYSSNITPDTDTGIGDYSLNDFDRAVRRGIKRDDTTMYPAMPYPSYARMTDEDIVALYAYFMRGVHPVHAENHANEIPWPLSIRWPLAIWRKVLAPSANSPPFDPSRYPDPVVARGAYLVQGPGHCGSCHTPRAATLQEKSLDDRGRSKSAASYLAGGQVIDGWVAVNLRGNAADGLGNWTVEDIVKTLRSARNAGHAVVGTPMSDAVVHGTQNLTDADLDAIARYLKTLPPTAREKSTYAADPQTAQALKTGREINRGAQLYIDNCSACHRTNGEGDKGVFPTIAGNSTVLGDDASTVVHLILKGSSLPPTNTAPSALGMPGVGWRLSDEEVAQLASFIRASWGNHASAVSAAQVRTIRASLPERPPPKDDPA
ncbi:MAG TPA: c-type cytochrome [Steroidobacteraceae bacterium]|nr:c-type cytochrome [Steroidobacteraceae bacterium]